MSQRALPNGTITREVNNNSKVLKKGQLPSSAFPLKKFIALPQGLKIKSGGEQEVTSPRKPVPIKAVPLPSGFVYGDDLIEDLTEANNARVQAEHNGIWLGSESPQIEHHHRRQPSLSSVASSQDGSINSFDSEASQRRGRYRKRSQSTPPDIGRQRSSPVDKRIGRLANQYYQAVQNKNKNNNIQDNFDIISGNVRQTNYSRHSYSSDTGISSVDSDSESFDFDIDDFDFSGEIGEPREGSTPADIHSSPPVRMTSQLQPVPSGYPGMIHPHYLTLPRNTQFNADTGNLVKVDSSLRPSAYLNGTLPRGGGANRPGLVVYRPPSANQFIMMGSNSNGAGIPPRNYPCVTDSHDLPDNGIKPTQNSLYKSRALSASMPTLVGNVSEKDQKKFLKQVKKLEKEEQKRKEKEEKRRVKQEKKREKELKKYQKKYGNRTLPRNWGYVNKPIESVYRRPQLSLSAVPIDFEDGPPSARSEGPSSIKSEGYGITQRTAPPPNSPPPPPPQPSLKTLSLYSSAPDLLRIEQVYGATLRGVPVEYSTTNRKQPNHVRQMFQERVPNNEFVRYDADEGKFAWLKCPIRWTLGFVWTVIDLAGFTIWFLAKEIQKNMFKKKIAQTKSKRRKVNEYAPRSVVLQKGPEGYGFVLRGAKSQTNAAGELDFRPSSEFPALQYLDSVDPGSRSDRAGLKTGDFILEINGENVVRASHDRVVQLIRQSGDTLALKVVTVKPMEKPQHWLQHHDGTMTLPNRNSKKPAPQPPQRDPQTSLSYSKARGKSITEGMAEIDQIGGPKGSSSSTDHLDMVLADYDQQPDQISLSSEHKTASIRSKHSAKRVSCIELDKLENPDSNASVMSTKGKAPAPQPKDYMSPSEMRIKKYHKGKSSGLERSSSTPDLLDGGRKPEPVYATPILPGDGRRSSSGAINNVYAMPGERPKGPPPPPPAGSSTSSPKRQAPAPPKGSDVVQNSKTEVVTISTDKRSSIYSNANDGKVIDRRKSEYESSFRPGISASLTDEPKISTPSLQQAKLSNRTHNRNSSQISVQSSDSSGSKNSEDKPSVSFAEDKVMVNAESFLQKHPNAQLLVTAEVHKKTSERKPSEPEPDYDAESDDNKESSASNNSVTVISVGGASDNNAKKFTVKSDIPTGSPKETMVIPPPPSEPAPEPPKPSEKEKISSGASTQSDHSRQSSISDVSNAPPAPPPPPVAPPAPPPPPIQAPDREKTPPPVAENKPKKPLGVLPTTDILAAVEKRKTRIENDGIKISEGPNKEVKPRNSTDLRNKLIENTQAAILEAVAKRRAKLEQTSETEVADQIESRLQKTKKLQTSKMYFSSDTIQKKETSTVNKKEEVKSETKANAVFSSDSIAKKKPPSPSPKRAPSPKNKPPSPVPSQKNKAPVPIPTKEKKPAEVVVPVKEKSPVYVSPVKKDVSATSVKSISKQTNSKTDTTTSEKKEDVKVNGDLNGEDFVAMAEKARQDWIKKRSSSSLLLKTKPEVKSKSGEKSKTDAPTSPKKTSNGTAVPPKTNGIVIESAGVKGSDKKFSKKASPSASPAKTTSASKVDSRGITPLKSARDTVMIAKSTSIRARIANFEQSGKPEGNSSNPTSPRSKIPVHGVTTDSTTTETQKRSALPPPPGFGDAVHLEIIPPPTGFSVTDGPESPPYSAFHHDDSSSVSTLSTLSDDALDGRPRHGYEDLIAPPPPGFDDNSGNDNILPSVIPPPPDFGGSEVKNVSKLRSLGNKPFESKPVESWQCLDVLDWLDSLNMTQYKNSFQQRCVDGKKLAGLTRNDYIQLGVTQVGHRMNLERSIKKVSAKKFSS